MQKSITQIQVEVEGKQYQFLCDNDSPLSIVKQVLMGLHEHCETLEKAILEEKAKQPEDQPIECC